MYSVMKKIGVVICVTTFLSGCTVDNTLVPFDESKLVLLQFEEMQEGEDIAVITTSEGVITLRFFPSEAPKAVKNFITLAQEGYFDGQTVVNAEFEEHGTNNSFVAGTPHSDGKPGDTIYDKSYKQEISYNLGPFPGAVAVLCDSFNMADSRFLVLGSNEVPQAQLEAMEREGYPQKMLDKFEQEGGSPQHWLKSAIFAQVIGGMDVVDIVIQTAAGSEGQLPKEVTIETVSIEKYIPYSSLTF